MKDEIECRIEIDWDPEAAVWIATSRDVDGLVLESGSIEVLRERVKDAVQELVELNGERQKKINYVFTG